MTFVFLSTGTSPGAFDDAATEELLIMQGGVGGVLGRGNPRSAGGDSTTQGNPDPNRFVDIVNISPGGIGANNNGDLSPSGGDFAQQSGSGTTPQSADSTDRANMAVQKGLLGGHSQGWCARGTNNILSYYVNGTGMSSSGANANAMGPVLQQRYGMTAVADTGQYQNGDTRILQNGGNGHAETYMNGKWYSDFPQNGSLMTSGRYSSATLYRLPPGK